MSTVQLLGQTFERDGSGVVRLKDYFDTDVEDLWAALTEPDRLSRWLGEVDGDLRVGGTFRGHWHASGWEGDCTVEVCDRPHRIVVRTVSEDQPDGVVEITLTADGDRTVLVLEDRGVPLGGAMTAATLSGRRAVQELRAQVGTYEAALALGVQAPEAVRLVVEPTAREALTPGIDQTRTVGLVTLPGAYVGVLLGGGSAIDAGAAQVLVLVGLLAVQATTAAVVLGLVSTRRILPPTLAGLPT